MREAGRSCDAALAAMDQLARAHHLKAHVRMALGDHARAVSPLRRAVSLDPDQAGHREDLIRLLRAPDERAAARPRRPFDAFAPPPPTP